MISSARMRAAQRKLDEARPFYQTVGKTAEKKLAKFQREIKKVIVVAITADKGLCGSINSQVVKYAKNLMKDRIAKGKQVLLVPIGKKSESKLAKEYGKYVVFSVSGQPKNGYEFSDCCEIADMIMQHEADEIVVVYNHFKSVMQFVPTEKSIVPPSIMKSSGLARNAYMGLYVDRKHDVPNYTEYHLAATLFGALTENATSELGSRMTAMDNATKNASELIKNLTLRYNRQRQAGITNELIEIITGTEALKTED